MAREGGGTRGCSPGRMCRRARRTHSCDLSWDPSVGRRQVSHTSVQKRERLGKLSEQLCWEAKFGKTESPRGWSLVRDTERVGRREMGRPCRNHTPPAATATVRTTWGERSLVSKISTDPFHVLGKVSRPPCPECIWEGQQYTQWAVRGRRAGKRRAGWWLSALSYWGLSLASALGSRVLQSTKSYCPINGKMEIIFTENIIKLFCCFNEFFDEIHAALRKYRIQNTCLTFVH